MLLQGAVVLSVLALASCADPAYDPDRYVDNGIHLNKPEFPLIDGDKKRTMSLEELQKIDFGTPINSWDDLVDLKLTDIVWSMNDPIALEEGPKKMIRAIANDEVSLFVGIRSSLPVTAGVSIVFVDPVKTFPLPKITMTPANENEPLELMEIKLSKEDIQKILGSDYVQPKFEGMSSPTGKVTITPEDWVQLCIQVSSKGYLNLDELKGGNE